VYFSIERMVGKGIPMRLRSSGSRVPGRSLNGSSRGLAVSWIVREISLRVNQRPVAS